MTVRTKQARDAGYEVVHYLRKRITFTDVAPVVVGVLPAGAAIIYGTIHTVTTFNAGTNNNIDVGHAADSAAAADPDAYATLVASAAVGARPFDELAATTNVVAPVDRTVIATYVPTGTAATAGAADIIVGYVRAAV